MAVEDDARANLQVHFFRVGGSGKARPRSGGTRLDQAAEFRTRPDIMETWKAT